jgi:hypothetical protein
LFDRVADCFTDWRAPDLTVHPVRTMVAQRIAGIALGYEDIDDHDTLRHDPVLSLLSDRLETGHGRCAPLAGKSTLNRLELGGGAAEPDRYRKIGHDEAAFEQLFVDLFLEAHDKPPDEIVIDLDATDGLLHGNQEGRFYHGYYKGYCYLPLYIFCGEHLLAAKLRCSNIDGCAGSVEEMTRIVGQIRHAWPKVKIVLRADGGFARDDLMAWCEENRVDFIFGLARNPRLQKHIAPQMAEAEAIRQQTGEAARVFADFTWSTRDSWARPRRVVAKAEHTLLGSNPRFVVTSLGPDTWPARKLYEDLYCARGNMENRIKECQLDLFADRTSSHTMRANQLRLWFASYAYVLVVALRRIGLAGTKLAKSSCGSIRNKLLKIGARVTVSVRRIKIAMASGCPFEAEFVRAHERIGTAAL